MRMQGLPACGPISRTLTDEDCELIAQKFLDALSRRLATPPQATPAEVPLCSPATDVIRTTPPEYRKMAYSGKEVEDMLGVSTTTLWRMRLAGRIRPVDGVRRVIFSRDEVERFLRSSSSRDEAAWTPTRSRSAQGKRLRGL